MERPAGYFVLGGKTIATRLSTARYHVLHWYLHKCFLSRAHLSPRGPAERNNASRVALEQPLRLSEVVVHPDELVHATCDETPLRTLGHDAGRKRRKGYDPMVVINQRI